MNRFISKIRLAVIVASMFVLFSITSKVSWSQTPVTDAKSITMNATGVLICDI